MKLKHNKQYGFQSTRFTLSLTREELTALQFIVISGRNAHKDLAEIGEAKSWNNQRTEIADTLIDFLFNLRPDFNTDDANRFPTNR